MITNLENRFMIAKNEKSYRFYARLVVQAVLIIFAFLLYINISSTYTGISINGIDIEIPIQDMLMVPFVAFSGYFSGFVLAVAVGFYQEMFISKGNLYFIMLYMLMAIIVGIVNKRRWFLEIKKLIYLSAYLSLIGGCARFFIINRLTMIPVFKASFMTYLGFFCSGFLCAFCGCLVPFAVFKYSKDKILAYIPMGKFYFRDNRVIHETSRLGKKIVIIMMMAVALIGVATAVNIQYTIGSVSPYLARHSRDVFNSYMGAGDEDDKDYSKRPISYNLSTYTKNPEYVAPITPAAYLISIELKLFLLILTAVLPLGVFLNLYLRTIVVTPLSMIALAEKNFALSQKNQDKLLDNGIMLHDLNIKTGTEVDDIFEASLQAEEASIAYVDELKKNQKLQEDLRVSHVRNETKTIILSNMSHEIRTPINSIVGLTEIIRRTSKEKATQEYASGIAMSSEYMLSLINDILDYSRLEKGNLEIKNVEYELSQILGDVFSKILHGIREKNINLDIEIDENIPHLLCGDSPRIKQMLFSIINTGVRYSNDEGNLMFRISYSKDENKEDEIILKIEFGGKAIYRSPEELKHVFRLGELSGDDEGDVLVQEIGLNLGVIKKVMELMGAYGSLEKTKENGTILNLVLPQKVIKWEGVGQMHFEMEEEHKLGSKYQESFHAEEAKILVVDDTQINLTVMKELLRKTLVNIDTAQSGKEAIDMIKKTKYDIIFLDHMMPEMDGIETLMEIKKIPQTENPNYDTPIIALTANAIAGARENYISKGFNDYMSKPVRSSLLEQMLEEYIPEEKVSRFVDVEEKEEDFTRKLSQVEGIDVNAALDNSGGESVLSIIIPEFIEEIDAKASDMERSLESEDFKLLTIQAHALKSSARLIGAIELSKNAEEVENLGENQETDIMKEKAKALIEFYRSFLDRFSLFETCSEDSNSGMEDGKECISCKQIKEAIEYADEFASVFDFDSIISVMDSLNDYRMDKVTQSFITKIKKSAELGDMANINDILQNLKKIFE